MPAAPVLAVLGPRQNPDGTPARQNGGATVERLAQMASVEHTVEVGHAPRDPPPKKNTRTDTLSARQWQR